MLENGYGSIQTVSFPVIKELLSTSTAVGGDDDTNTTLQLVVVSSSQNSYSIGKAFVDAGAPHVVCCHREGNSKYRDPIANAFIQCFYRQLAQQKILRESFDSALKTVISSPHAKYVRQVKKRFHLLPATSSSSSSSSTTFNDDGGSGDGCCMDGYHDIPVFFNAMSPVVSKDEDDDNDYDENNNNNSFETGQLQNFTPLSDHFIGREFDMYEILELLQVDDLVRISSGTSGHGKHSIVTAVCEYVLQRRDMFSIDYVYSIPILQDQQQHTTAVVAAVEPDSVYDDLILCCNLIRTSKNKDIWDTNNEILLEARARLEVELEDRSMIVVVDDSTFSSKECQVALDKFIHFILTNGAATKVIRISASRGNDDANISGSSSRSIIEESHIELDPLDFRSTALLFGEVSKYISNNMCTEARSAKEFADLMEPSFGPQIKGLSVIGSCRRADIFERMGNGLSANIITAAKSMNLTEFEELIKIAGTPEIHVDSTRELESELLRWTLFKEQALKDKNYQRALDLNVTIEELEGMRNQFPSLKDLKEKEQLIKSDLADAVSNRRYDVANELKRELLVLKKEIMKERRIATNQLSETPNDMMTNFQAKVNSLIKNTQNESTEDDDDGQNIDKINSFDIDCDGHYCKFFIIFNVKSCVRNASKGIVCWSNEACDLEQTADGSLLSNRGGEKLQKDVANLPVVAETQYGPVRCMTGKSLTLASGPLTRIKATIILSVGPYGSPSGQYDVMLEGDKYFLHYCRTMLQSCYRSCIKQANEEKLHVLAISPLTTCTKNGCIYEEMIQIGLQTLSEEVKFSQLKEVHIIARSHQEVSIMTSTMQAMGYTPILKEEHVML